MKDACNLYVSFNTSVVHWSGRAHTNIAPVSWTENTESFSQICFEVTRSIEGQLIYETMYSNFCNFKLPHQDWRQWRVLGEHLEECGIGFQCFGDSVWNNWVLILLRINIILYFIAARNHRSSTSFQVIFQTFKKKGRRSSRRCDMSCAEILWTRVRCFTLVCMGKQQCGCLLIPL